MSEKKDTSFRRIHEEIITTPDLDLASCLATLGIPFHPECPFMKVVNTSGKEITQFHFLARSTDGRFETKHLVRCWEDQAFAAANEEHPIIYAKFALMNRKRLVDSMKSETPFVTIKKTVNGKPYTYLVRENSEAHNRLTGKQA